MIFVPKTDEMRAAIEACIAKNPPKTAEDCCRLAVEVDIMMHGGPVGDVEIINRASQIAAGVFGCAFRAMSEFQRLGWIDLCEEKYREIIRTN